MASLLLVDDEAANLLALHAVLEPLGHQLVDARSGRDALRLLLEHRFSLVLLDVRMPGMDGIETAALMRQREKTHGVPIVFLTAASPDMVEVQRGYAEGAADYLVKPFDPDILRAKVQALVNAQEAAVEAQVAARLEAALEERRAREEADRAAFRDQFLSTLSHELRTPLLAILGWVRLLRLGKASADPAGRALQSIERNARVQERMVDELLDMQRIASGKMSLSFKEVAFGALVRDVVRELLPEAEEKGVALRTALPADEDLFVHGDEARLKQIVTHLLRNAIKFTLPDGNARAAVFAEDIDLVLVVSDDGRGLAPEFFEQVFEPFAQQQMGPTREHGGFGLGLSTVRALVELHGGSIAAHSDGEGRGASFQVSLPLRSRVPAPFAPAARRPRAPAPEVSLQGLSVLVVDDDPDALYLIATMLEQFGGRVTTVSSAREAIDALGGGHFDLLLSDISMPGEDGYSLVRRVRSGVVSPQIPAVALTANARREDRARALAAGFQAHLAKPIDPGDLASALRSLVSRS